MDAKEQTEKAAHERVKGFDRTKRILSFHIYRLHKRAKKYTQSRDDEERYHKTLKSMGYLSQVLTAAQRSAFEEEMKIAGETMEFLDGVKAEYERLKRMEARYLEVIGAQPK